MDWAKAVTWPVVILGTALCATTAVLVIWGHASLKDIGTLATTLIGAVVLLQLKATRDQASRIEANGNGHLKALQEKLDQANRTIAQMAAQLPPDSPLPKALADEE